jgi:preprotein translocase subunit Sss1/K+/H+ antiporter YhaU regulatory subunit KhtT
MTESAEQRSYGQGAQGEIAAPTKTKVSFFTRLRYNFDNSLSNSGSFVAYVFVAMILLAILMTAVKALVAIPAFLNQAPGEQLTYFDVFWGSFSTILTLAGQPTWAERIVAVLYWAIGIAVTGTVIGFITSMIQRAVARLKSGKSPVIESGHVLILGWSNRVFPILRELAVANQNVRKPLVVIFSSETREKMDDEIESRTGDLGKLRVITRTGDITNPADLKRANVGGAKSVIILDADETGDATVVSTVLAVKSVNPNPALKIIAEVDDRNTAEALTSATNGQVLTVRSHDVIARVTAQASRQPGLAAVTLDLLDFDGDEIYFNSVPALAGKTYADALLAFNTASVIGLVHENGKSELNPKATTKLTAGTKIIAIAEDDDKVVYTGVREEISKKKFADRQVVSPKPEHLLVIGWSSMGRSVINELSTFLPKGSSVHIVAQSRYVDPTELAALKFGTLKVTHATTSGDIDELIAAAKAKKYNEVIILGYRNAISESEADAQTMLTMLQMNQLFATDGNGVEPTRLVAEILDSRKAELARVAAADDLVVSDNLAALLIAQIAENPALAPIFDDLFDAAGASINVKPIEQYVPIGKSVEYAQLVAVARTHGESAIGYRFGGHVAGDASTGVELNPTKTQEFTPVPGDSLIVIGNL